MADLGAEVIKIEPPAGEQTRTFVHQRNGRSGYFIQQNLGKQDLAVDLRKEQGRELALELTAISDVVVESYRPGVMERLGLDYPTLRQANPSIVLCSISAFGQYGPYSDRRGGDYNIQALSGMMVLNGEENGPPMWTGNAYCDTTTGLHAFGATVSALYRRLQTGQGEHVDLALLDCAIWHQEIAFQQYVLSDGKKEQRRSGSARTDNAPVNVYRGRDGYMVLAAMSESAWQTLVEVMEIPGLLSDDRFATWFLRVENRNALDRLIEEWICSFTSVDDVIERLLGRGLVCGKVRSVPQIIADPNTHVREMLVKVYDPAIEEQLPIVNSPMRFSGSSAYPRGPAPLLGQDTSKVLTELLGSNSARALGLLGNGTLTAEDLAIPKILQQLGLPTGRGSFLQAGE
jgi:crotonobetainyl-CoA:carnitine CoA-transferase CaiB-like acyl-CoA transferase